MPVARLFTTFQSGSLPLPKVAPTPTTNRENGPVVKPVVEIVKNVKILVDRVDRSTICETLCKPPKYCTICSIIYLNTPHDLRENAHNSVGPGHGRHIIMARTETGNC